MWLLEGLICSLVALNPWDIAAGAFLIQEAGGQVSDFNLEIPTIAVLKLRLPMEFYIPH